MTGREIKVLRKCLGLTQKELSAAIGCRYGTVQQWEQGNRHPNETFLPRLEKLVILAKKETKEAGKVDKAEAVK